MKTKSNNKSPVSALCSVLGTAILIAVILICLPLTMSGFFGGQFLAVVSGSMEPEIPTGSLVYVKGANPEEIQEDEIIAFYAARDPGTIVTHRVVENHKEEQELITKGDANNINDMNPTRYQNFIGRVEFHLPYIGFVTQMMTSVPGKIAVGSMIGLAIALHIMADSLDKRKKEIDG